MKKNTVKRINRIFWVCVWILFMLGARFGWMEYNFLSFLVSFFLFGTFCWMCGTTADEVIEKKFDR